DPHHLKATGKPASALTCDVNGAGAVVDSQIGAAGLSGDEPAGSGNSAAQVQHGNAGGDAGLTRQCPNLSGAHEALLLDELAGRIRRHARSPERLEERSA